MSKRLENEYKTLMNNNVPDLWAKIESGLEPKEGVPDQDGQAASFRAENRADVKRENGRRTINYRIWGMAAAACICAAVAIPAWLMHSTKNAERSDTNYAAADNAAADASVAENAGGAASDDRFADVAVADNAASDSAASDSGPMNSTFDTACAEAAEEEAAENVRGDAASGAILSEKDMSQDSITEDGTLKQASQETFVESVRPEETADEAVFTVTIRGIREDSQRIIYTARVEEAEDGALVGTEIEIYAGTDKDERLEKDVQYRLELIRAAQEDGKIIFYQKTP